MEDLKNRVEALLFSAGKKVSVEELSRLSRAKPEEVISALKELKSSYDEKGSSLMVIEEGNSWKLSVREAYLPLVQKIVAETELTKTIMETLAVVAYKAPVLQSDIIKARTNKAYDHLIELEETGFITREKKGRTKLLRLTQKFFTYFDLKDKQDIQERFKLMALTRRPSLEIEPVEKELDKEEEKLEEVEEELKDELKK